MKARFLALALSLAWPSFAHAGWIYDNIGRPITGGLGLGAHQIKDAMVTGTKQTGGAFSSAARQSGLDRRSSGPAPPSAAPAADKKPANAQSSSSAEPRGR